MVFTDKISPFSFFGGEKLLTTCVFYHMNLNMALVMNTFHNSNVKQVDH